MNVQAVPNALLVWLVLTVATATATPKSIRVDDFRKDIPKVAKMVKKIVEGEEQSAVAVGRFIGPAQHDANAGPGIELLLSRALESLQKGLVQKKAELSVQGSYALIEKKVADGNNVSRVFVKLRVEVFDRNADRIAEFVMELHSNRDIALIAGATVSLRPDGSKAERNRELGQRIHSPHVHVDGTRIKSNKKSKYAVELRVKREKDHGPAAARAATVKDGQAFVNIKRGEIYEVVIHNGSRREVAVAVTIDGLDAFIFSEAREPRTRRPKYSHYLIGAGETAAIVGWHIRDEPPANYLSFRVTAYGKGASTRARHPSQGKIGVVTVSFARTFPPGTRASSETGFGPPRSVTLKAVKRDIDPPHEFVTIRYAR